MNRDLLIVAIFTFASQLSFGHEAPLVHGRDLGFSGPALCENITFDQWLTPVIAFQAQESLKISEQFPDWYRRASRGEQANPTSEDINALNGFVRNRFSVISEQVRKVFNEVKDKMEPLLNTCCSDDKRCAAQLNGVTLLIADDLQGNYNQSENRIELGSARANQMTSIEEAQWFIVHELGHACQHALTTTTGSTTDVDREIKVLLDVHTHFFGSEFLSCIEKFSQNDTARLGRGYDSNTRVNALRETFAEAVFAPFLRNSLHWLGANTWGGYKAANICRFSSPILKRQWCDQREVLYR